MTDELRVKFEAWTIDAEITHEDVSALWAGDGYADGYIGALWEGFEAAHASRDAEVAALKEDIDRVKSDDMQALAAVVDAAGGRVMVRPHHILEAKRGKLIRDIDPETGGCLFRREHDISECGHEQKRGEG